MSETQADGNRGKWRRSFPHVRSRDKSPVNRSPKYHDALVYRALCWAHPWSRAEYPGRMRASLKILSNSVKWGAVQAWFSGKNSFPAWAARAIADHIETRVKLGQEIIRELRDHADHMDAQPPKPLHGFCKIKADGQDGRGNWRRRG